MTDLEIRLLKWRVTWPEWAKQSAVTTNTPAELTTHTNITKQAKTNMNTTPKENIVDHVHGATLIDHCRAYQSLVLDLEDRVRSLSVNGEVTVGFTEFDRGECLANITLAVRHLEDARMRLGKVIEARAGRSCYEIYFVSKSKSV